MPPPPLPPPHGGCVQENILAESSAMLPDTRQRLEEALQELQGLVVRIVLQSGLAESLVKGGLEKQLGGREWVRLRTA